MSLELDWDKLTGGPEGEALAETIREFIHDRFQKVTLPKMIRSVKVHAFDFGSTAPDLVLKDVCDPLPDFYEDDDDNEVSPLQDETDASPATQPLANTITEGAESRFASGGDDSRRRNSQKELASPIDANAGPAQIPSPPADSRPLLSRSSTPGIPGGTSNMSYFHLPLSAGLSGAATPFAAFGGAHGWLENQHSPWHHHETGYDSLDRRLSSPGTMAASTHMEPSRLDAIPETPREKTSEDVQIVAHVRYSGDVKLSMTADILLDYPMPSFVGIPLQLKVTGMTFDGVAILAYIKKKAHFCFLAPEDAEALLDGEAPTSDDDNDEGNERHTPSDARQPAGRLFEQIKVESEIGQRAHGKQVLKNVSKVENFVLEQVRRIFETEFVYPSFWTFLV